VNLSQVTAQQIDVSVFFLVSRMFSKPTKMWILLSSESVTGNSSTNLKLASYQSRFVRRSAVCNDCSSI